MATTQALLRLLQEQDNVVSRAQALERGMTESEWYARCHGHAGWRRTTAGVCVVGDEGLLQRAWAARLAVGEDAVLTGLAVLVLLGLRLDAPRLVLAAVPENHNVRRPAGVRPVRCQRPPVVHPVRRPAQATAPRAAVDAATYEAVSEQQSRFYLVRSVQDGLVLPAQLQTEVGKRLRLRHGAAIREHIDELCDGVRSLRERDFLLALDRRGTRRPDRLQKRTDAAGRRWIDAWWEQERVMAEVQGPQHFDADVTAGELLRVSALSVPGDRALIQVPSWLLPHDAGAFLDLLDAALAAGRGVA